MHRVLRAVLASGAGATIGGLIAFQMAFAFWWVGVIIGGLVAYLLVDPTGVARAIPQAYAAARGWQPDRIYWGAVGWEVAWIYSMMATSMLLLFALMTLVGRLGVIMGSPADSLPSVIVVAVVFPSFVSVLMLVIKTGWTAERLAEDAQSSRKFCFVFFPPMFFFWYLPRWIYRGIVRFPNATLRFGRFMRLFSLYLFVRIHSNLRLACLVDAAFGAAIGYFTGHLFVCTAAGAILGALNAGIVIPWLERSGALPIRAS